MPWHVFRFQGKRIKAKYDDVKLLRVQYGECIFHSEPVADSRPVQPQSQRHQLRLPDPLYERKHDKPRLQYAAVDGISHGLRAAFVHGKLRLFTARGTC